MATLRIFIILLNYCINDCLKVHKGLEIYRHITKIILKPVEWVKDLDKYLVFFIFSSKSYIIQYNTKNRYVIIWLLSGTVKFTELLAQKAHLANNAILNKQAFKKNCCILNLLIN